MERLKRVVAENNSLAAKLDECRHTIALRDKEIDMLHTMVADARAARSATDNKMEELNLLQNYIAEIKEVMQNASLENNANHTAPASAAVNDEMDELKELNAYLSVQLKELKAEAASLKERNKLLEQKSANVAELQSKLNMAIEERDGWKNYVMSKG